MAEVYNLSNRLVCPVSHSPLIPADKEKVLETLGPSVQRMDRYRSAVRNEEIPNQLLLREDGSGAYPVVDGIPILMAPEMFVREGRGGLLDTKRDPYREAYEEMEFYNAVATTARADITKSDAYEIVGNAVKGGAFPGPEWLDASYELVAQAEAYAFMAPMDDMVALQMGGKGIHAVKFLLAGAHEAWLVTPMLGEAILGRDLAGAFGVADKFRSVVGIAEELPLADTYFDRAYSGGCVHHMITERAFPEIRRVLKPGGKFAAIEPWLAPLYKLGTKILGKRERGVNCRPLEADRITALYSTFDDPSVNHHGTFTRYGLIALGKAGIQPRNVTLEKVFRLDDRFATKLSMRHRGSSVALMGRRRS